MVLIETPGLKGKFKARTRAIIKFTDCFQYKNETAFYADFKGHRVSKNSPWAWMDAKPKWGWKVELIKRIPEKKMSNKGIVYTKDISM